MAMIQAYVFIRDKRPGYLNIERETKAKLETYLVLLKNYHSLMVEDDHVMLVAKAEYKENHAAIPGHFLKSTIETAAYPMNEALMSKESFQEWVFFDTDHFIMTNSQSLAITYATGVRGSVNIMDSDIHTFAESRSKRNELKRTIKIKSAQIIASSLDMEMLISVGRPGKELTIQRIYFLKRRFSRKIGIRSKTTV